jgi:transcriptional regulator with XRE-family HTH domain
MSKKASIVDDLRRAIAKAERSGVTRYRMAKAAGLAESQVGRIAKGETVPTLGVAERLAKGIGYRLAIVPILAK